MIASFFRKLAANLAAGARLALFRRVTRLDFRISAGQFIAVALVAMACASLVDLVLVTDAVRFNGEAIGGQLRDSALLLLLGWIIATALRVPAAAAALPLVFLAAGCLTDVVFAALLWGRRALGTDLGWLASGAWWAMLAWSAAIAWRTVSIVLQGEGRFGIVPRTAAVATLFGGTLALALVAPSEHLWDKRPDEAAGRGPRVESEEALAAQPRLLFDALANLEEHEPGQQNVYFVGFAGDSTQDVFRNDMEAAREVMDERLDTEGRSIILINSPRTLFDTPLATVSNLRAALTTVGRLMDPDADLAVIYLSSHGSADHQLYVNFPPLVLQQLTPTSLSRMLQDAGIRWKVIIVSACYSGGYVEPLKDPDTVVVTSARSDRASFGCDAGSEFTYFGEAFFQQALKQTDSLLGAFEQARVGITRREKAEGRVPSEPQIYVGEAIRKKLESRAQTSPMAANLAPVLVGVGVDHRHAALDRQVLVAERDARDPQ
jgi:hypothetical protein